MAMAATWDIPVPIIIEIISWLDQESLINLSLVSKQMHDIICSDEPGNKNKIISVFEVSGSSTLKLLQNLRGYFLNEKTKKRLQSYHIMTFKDPCKFKYDANVSQLLWMVEKDDVQMNGITSLDFSSPSPKSERRSLFCLASILPRILPKLREVDFSNTVVDYLILQVFSENCPLLEKVTTHNNHDEINLCGLDMSHSRYLKEIHMGNNVKFSLHIRDRKKMLDLYNGQDIFIFHHCCKAFERVSIQNMKYHGLLLLVAADDWNLNYTQNLLIKFVRNAPPTLR
jgi:hypothetical protein